jgi:redox-sensitive bicupin YhaK (pirin superfamily)
VALSNRLAAWNATGLGRVHSRFSDIGRAEHAPGGPLHIWNGDNFAQHFGFDMHTHENVGIATFVRSGAITHQHSFGNRGQSLAYPTANGGKAYLVPMPDHASKP